jgi:hypothetical protein
VGSGGNERPRAAVQPCDIDFCGGCLERAEGLRLSAREAGLVLAVFPLAENRVAVVVDERSDAKLQLAEVGFRSGLSVESVEHVDDKPYRYVLMADATGNPPHDEDQLVIRGRPTGPRFLHRVLTPMELKVGHLTDEFPFSSTRVGVHVSVACCTGCNGGVHDRGLVVINGHIGGPWTGLWVQTDLEIPSPYPRWQRTLFAGGVVEERQGSTVVADHGWMTIEKLDEEPHHAPPALRIETADLPRGTNHALAARGLDGTWVEFRDLTVDEVERREPSGEHGQRLYRTEIAVSDVSGGVTAAWLYQESAAGLRPGERIAILRGFVHGEAPGHFVLLSDKNEDISVEARSSSRQP